LIDHASAQKKNHVGSLFFHLFHRISVWIYMLLCNCFPARLLTSYERLEARWEQLCTTVFGTPDAKLRRNLHMLRLRIAGLLEHSKLLGLAARFVRFLVYCPLNVYGIFLFVYGAVSAVVYFIAPRISVNYAGDDIIWGITGIVLAVASLPLLCTGKSLYRVAFGSRVLGKLLRGYLGLEPLGQEKRERGNTVLVYLALLLGAALGALTFFYHPATVPLLILLLAALLVVLYIPEAGVLLALATFSLWWVTGQPTLCAVGIAAVTLISFINKLIRGKRVIHVRLLDFAVLLLGTVFATHGIFSQGGIQSLFYGIGYTLLIGMYFPTVNLIRSREWLNRCYGLLAISGAFLSVISLLELVDIISFLKLLLMRVDLSMMDVLFERYTIYFGQGSVVGGMLLMLIPLMLADLSTKRTVTGFVWKTLWLLAGCVSVVIAMQVGVWVGLGVALLLFFFTYSYKSLSATILLAFPAACGVAWFSELDRLFNIRNIQIVQAMTDVLYGYAGSMADRSALWNSVLSMTKDHMLGTGLGEHAVHAVFPQYAPSGMEGVTDMQNAYVQLLAECGWIAVIMLFAVLLLFCICVLTYLHWGGHKITKARVAAGFAGVAGVLCMGIACNFWNSASVFALLWLVIALTVASVRTQYDTQDRAINTHIATEERADIAFRSK